MIRKSEVNTVVCSIIVAVLQSLTHVVYTQSNNQQQAATQYPMLGQSANQGTNQGTNLGTNQGSNLGSNSNQVTNVGTNQIPAVGASSSATSSSALTCVFCSSTSDQQCSNKSVTCDSAPGSWCLIYMLQNNRVGTSGSQPLGTTSILKQCINTQALQTQYNLVVSGNVNSGCQTSQNGAVTVCICNTNMCNGIPTGSLSTWTVLNSNINPSVGGTAAAATQSTVGNNNNPLVNAGSSLIQPKQQMATNGTYSILGTANGPNSMVTFSMNSGVSTPTPIVYQAAQNTNSTFIGAGASASGSAGLSSNQSSLNTFSQTSTKAPGGQNGAAEKGHNIELMLAFGVLAAFLLQKAKYNNIM